ncbi:MAG: winged helix-turn-helix domain-containing protein [Planctomycetota bacterium]
MTDPTSPPPPPDRALRSMQDIRPDEEAPIDAGTIRILPSRYEVFIESQRVELTLTQFRILSIMARRPGWVFTPEQIARSLARDGIEVESSAMRNHIYMMRRKLGRSGGKQLQTVRGVGYRVATDSGSPPSAAKADAAGPTDPPAAE